MPYDLDLAERIRHALRGRHDIVEKKLFGGLGFLLSGNMCVGIWKESLIARIGPEAYTAALQEPHVQEFDITGRPMRGWVVVAPEGVETPESLLGWLARAVAFVEMLPEKG